MRVWTTNELGGLISEKNWKHLPTLPVPPGATGRGFSALVDEYHHRLQQRHLTVISNNSLLEQRGANGRMNERFVKTHIS